MQVDLLTVAYQLREKLQSASEEFIVHDGPLEILRLEQERKFSLSEGRQVYRDA